MMKLEKWFKTYDLLKKSYQDTGLLFDRNNYKEAINLLFQVNKLENQNWWSKNTIDKIKKLEAIGYSKGKVVLQDNIVLDLNLPHKSRKWYLKAFFDLKEITCYIKKNNRFYKHKELMENGENPVKVLSQIKKTYPELFKDMLEKEGLEAKVETYQALYQETKKDHWEDKLEALQDFLNVYGRLPKTPSEWHPNPRTGLGYDLGQVVNTIRRNYKKNPHKYEKVNKIVEKMPGWTWEVYKTREDFVQKISVCYRFLKEKGRLPFLDESYSYDDLVIDNFSSYFNNLVMISKKPEVFKKIIDMSFDLIKSPNLQDRRAGYLVQLKILNPKKGKTGLSEKEIIDTCMNLVFDCKFFKKHKLIEEIPVSLGGINFDKKISYLYNSNNYIVKMHFTEKKILKTKELLESMNIKLFIIKDLSDLIDPLDKARSVVEQVTKQLDPNHYSINFFENRDLSKIDFFNTEERIVSCWRQKIFNLVDRKCKKTKNKITRSTILNKLEIGYICDVIFKLNKEKIDIPSFYFEVLKFYQE